MTKILATNRKYGKVLIPKGFHVFDGHLKEKMLRTPVLGSACIAKGWQNDAMGESFNPESFYHTEVVDGHLVIFKSQ